MSSTGEVAIIRCELEMAQRALKLQTRRCRQLVAEFTRKLQAKELQLVSERQLKDEQLSRVLRSLLVFESRLKQEQTLLRHELKERDDLINTQKKEMKRLKFTMQFCKTCREFCSGNLDSCDSSSEYCGWESGSEFASVTDSNLLENSSSSEETSSKEAKVSYEKNKNGPNTDSYKRPKKHNIPRRTTGTYFEVLKLREEEEEKEANSFSTRMDSLHGIRKSPSPSEDKPYSSLSTNSSTESEATRERPPSQEKEKKLMISETIPVFDNGETDTNDNWYASGSDGEDENQRDIYRNNPVLECMNQILLQNINDTNNSPPHSPEMDRNVKSKKRVKFSDEKVETIETPTPSSVSYVDAIEIKKSAENDYYETPIQVNANFYEVPQSIYSNDYEQILSKCGGDSVQNWPVKSNKENIQENKINRMTTQKMTLVKNNNLENLDNKHYYVDMDTKTPSPTPRTEILKKTKVSRTPPALPPKPANLVSKFKIQSVNNMSKSCENLDSFSVESEPDYCSISELNLPPQKIILSPKPSMDNSIYDPISLEGSITSLIGKSPEKGNMQAPKQPQVKNERVVTNMASIAQISMLKNKKDATDIPKLPQVSEIIIPDENEEKDKKVDHISQDNYIKNNSQLLKQRHNSQPSEKVRGPIILGSSVSSLISGFNNHILSEITPRRAKSQERMFSNFDRSQSYEKHDKQKETPNFDKFDLSQNFEEFNLDDCEIGEDFQSEPSDSLNFENNEVAEKEEVKIETKPEIKPQPVSNTSVEIVRATKTVQSPQSIHNLQQIQKNLNCQRHMNDAPKSQILPQNPEPSYEHFLECTGLSSKSILTPSRMLSNHKSVLKPKDIKLRSKYKSAIFEHSGGTIKYWSEPYL